MDANLKDELPDRIAGALSALDRGAARRAEAVDASRIAERVLQRLKDEPVRVLHPPRISLRGLRVAAALAVLVIGGVVTQRLVFGPGRASVAALPILPPVAAGSTTVDASQQQAILDAIEEMRTAPGDSTVIPAAVSVEDLDVPELQALLSSMDEPQHGGTE
ncbi:MAG TPA: hypothetical protein VGI92_13725 [Gemmatimonadales bacterium]|jgi:hypothetical protein